MPADRVKVGLALSGGGHRAAFFHIGVLAKLAEQGILRRIEVISTVSGGSIVGALYYLHVKNLLEQKPDREIVDADFIEIVRKVERDYRLAAAKNVRGAAWSSVRANARMVKPTYTRTDRVGELYERHFYAGAWGARPKVNGRILMRDLLIKPSGHEGDAPFDPYTENANRSAPVPILLLEATTMNTGHNWRFEAKYLGEPPRQHGAAGQERADVDKNLAFERTAWSELPEACRDFPLGSAVVSSACFPGGFPPMQIPGLPPEQKTVIDLIDGGVHDNQGIEGLRDCGCTHLLISDGSGQMPELPRPSTRLPAVLGRVVSIYGESERQERLLDALAEDTTFLVHLQTGLPAETQSLSLKAKAAPAPLTMTECGVDVEVQRALANIRTDLDAFCEVEAWALMANAYQLAGKVLDQRPQVAGLGHKAVIAGWAFDPVRPLLGQPNAEFLKVLHAGKERFFKPARMLRGGLAAVYTALLVAGIALAVVGWRLFTPHGTISYCLAIGAAVLLGIYGKSTSTYIRPLAILIFDAVIPALLVVPLYALAWLQLGAGSWWLRIGRLSRRGVLGVAPPAEVTQPGTPGV
ncbi:MAG TPA: patatin-like phospholipase family protein [Gaiellaceae bacterium]|nr:patatin-like phospholipase family protein [Gaiellaceae bacterium]